jgi:hypothetical protein
VSAVLDHRLASVASRHGCDVDGHLDTVRS